MDVTVILRVLLGLAFACLGLGCVQTNSDGVDHRVRVVHQVRVTHWSGGKIICKWEYTPDSDVERDKLSRLYLKARQTTTAGEANYFGPNADYVEILLVMREDDQIALRSWHPTAEKRSKVVATAFGLELLLDGKTRSEVMARQSIQYQEFRIVFDGLLKIVDVEF